ncbi:hypothetical protein [Pelagibacterium lentulum]|uniref:Uncharacterized protein n=1 Tax=Pelagibacterium lentulum TaxID=2029865 RepID=A0A916W2M5_9HYPH|nr:hypothetical protein [Pelagibacterium lentulum]GGA62430.1 hypothetical protein GCM10011499_36000 [Pelagibacterium lentulum]
MTKTHLETAENRVKAILHTQGNDRLAAIRQVLDDRRRFLRAAQRAAQLDKRRASLPNEMDQRL